MTDSRTDIITAPNGLSSGGAARAASPSHPSRVARVGGADASSVRLLRRVLGLNAASTAATGVATAALAGVVADAAEPLSAGWIRLIGVALVVLAADIALLTRSAPHRLVPGAFALAGLDAAWVGGTAVVVGLGWPGGWGSVVVGAVGVAVGGLAVAEWAAARRVSASMRPSRA